MAESSESFRAADREQFYVSASRFKEALTIYTDDKHQLLEAVRKSSHRPSAMDLVNKEISESDDETVTKKPSQPGAVEIVQRKFYETLKLNWPRKRNMRQLRSRGIRV